MRIHAPADGLQQMVAGGGKRFVALDEPHLGRAAVGAARDHLAVQKQDEPLVRAHVETQGRFAVGGELLAEPDELAAGRQRDVLPPDPRGGIPRTETAHVRVAADEPLRHRHPAAGNSVHVRMADRRHEQRQRPANGPPHDRIPFHSVHSTFPLLGKIIPNFSAAPRAVIDMEANHGKIRDNFHNMEEQRP